MSASPPPIFPFAAIVGQDQLKLALMLCAVNPLLGGVLIRGDKGTAKSTAARGLVQLLPPLARVAGCPFNCLPGAALDLCPVCAALPDAALEPVAMLSAVPFINLPLGATEDRVLGSLDFERALAAGKKVFQPGLLAAAHRGLLYIDEVNLLPDHLVDALLDVAAMGHHTVEREGLTLSHPAQITLLGTMNLEEGELRPQLLDRFAMMVEVGAPSDPRVRAEVVRRRLAFEADATAFTAQWEDQGTALRAQVEQARARLPRVTLSDALLLFISELCCEFGATSLRADIVLNKAARSHAALAGRIRVDTADIAACAELVLPHRRRRKPFEQAGLDRNKLEQMIDAASRQYEGDSPAGQDAASAPSAPEDKAPGGEPQHGDAPDTGAENTRHQRDRGMAPESPLDHPQHEVDALSGEESAVDANHAQEDREDDENHDGAAAQTSSHGAAIPEQVFNTDAAVAAPLLSIAGNTRDGIDGHRSVAHRTTRGASRGAVASSTPKQLAVDATLRHAVLRTPGELTVTRADLHEKVRIGQQANLILLVVDASGSMAARRRMEAVKACVLGLLEDAYRRRDHVGVIVFRGERAELVLAPTRNVELAGRALDALPTGGRTPLADALQLTVRTALATSRAEQLKPLVVLLSDGRGNVALAGSPTAADNPSSPGRPNPGSYAGGSADPWQQTLQSGAQLAERRIAALVLDTEQGVIRLGRAAQLAQAMQAEYLPLDRWSAETLAVTIRERLN